MLHHSTFSCKEKCELMKQVSLSQDFSVIRQLETSWQGDALKVDAMQHA
jgi:hypothetical protein